MGKRGLRSGAKSAGCASSACSASYECPYRVCSSAGDGCLSSGFGLGSSEGSGSGVGASRVAVVVESARVDHVGKRERGGVGATENEQAKTAENARTRVVRRRREEGA
jgi:hypothetical protein